MDDADHWYDSWAAITWLDIVLFWLVVAALGTAVVMRSRRHR